MSCGNLVGTISRTCDAVMQKRPLQKNESQPIQIVEPRNCKASRILPKSNERDAMCSHRGHRVPKLALNKEVEFELQ